MDMIRTLPTWDMKTDDKTKFRRLCVEYLFKTAKERQYANIQDSRAPERYVTIRELMPIDFDRKDWKVDIRTDYTKWLTLTVPAQTTIVIYKIMLLAEKPAVRNLMICQGFTGSNIIGLHDLTPLLSILPVLKKMDNWLDKTFLIDQFGSLDNIRMEAYFSEPYFFTQFDIAHLFLSGINNNDSEEIMLGGMVLEPRGKNIA